MGWWDVAAVYKAEEKVIRSMEVKLKLILNKEEADFECGRGGDTEYDGNSYGVDGRVWAGGKEGRVRRYSVALSTKGYKVANNLRFVRRSC